MCERCTARYADHVGDPLPALDIGLSEQGREVALMAQQSTLIAFGEMLVDTRCCLAPGWIALLGTATAQRVGALPDQLATMPPFLADAVKARVRSMIAHVVVVGGA
jgi:hypothetical protein